MSPFLYRGFALFPFFLLARRILGSCLPTSPPSALRIFSGVLSAAFAVLLTLSFGRFTHHLPAALWLASIFSLLSYLALIAFVPTPPPLSQTPGWRWHYLPFLLGFLFLSLLVGLIAIKLDFHDQNRTQAHAAVVESMLRGNFPPHLQVFPAIPLKYHYGADVFVAILAYAFGIPAYRAIDLVQILGWFSTWLAAFSLCRQIGMSRLGSLLTPYWALLSAGWIYLFYHWLPTGSTVPAIDLTWPDSYTVFHRYLDPGVISWFFQTPYCLGLPLLFTLLALAERGLKRYTRGLGLLIALVMGTLSIIQVNLFLASFLGIFCAIFLQKILHQISFRESISRIALIGAIAGGVAFFLGGFFLISTGYRHDALVFFWSPGYLDHALDAGKEPISVFQSLLWYLASFGSLLIWTPMALFGNTSEMLKKKQVGAGLILSIVLAVGFLFPQFFNYRLSWDIVKWFCTFQVAAVFLIMLVFSPKMRNLAIAIPLILCIGLDTLPSLRMLYGLAFLDSSHYLGKQRYWWSNIIPPLTEDTAYLTNLLRSSDWKELVLTTPSLSYVLSAHSGQAMALPDFNTVAFGVQPSLLEVRGDQVRSLYQNFSVDRLKNSRISWLIFPCPEFERTFSADSRATIESARENGALQSISSPPQSCWKIFHATRSPPE